MVGLGIVFIALNSIDSIKNILKIVPTRMFLFYLKVANNH